jgi:hypothetical protein
VDLEPGDRCRRRPLPRPARRSRLLFHRPVAKYRPRPWRRWLCRRPQRPLPNWSPRMRSSLPNQSPWKPLRPKRRSQHRPRLRRAQFPRVRPSRFLLRRPFRRSTSRCLRSLTPRSRTRWRAPLSGAGSLFGPCAGSPFSGTGAPIGPCPQRSASC